MKILVVGSGGREDALVWKISQSPLVSKIYCAPGNGGICLREKTECFPFKAEDVSKLADFALKEKVDLTVVGPETPLVAGIADLFEQNGLKVFGPKRAGARLEGSKVFAKDFMERYGIPTAFHKTFEDSRVAKDYALSNLPLVVKADGLAGGKGAIVCKTKEEAEEAIERIMVRKEFGPSGERVVIEEFLEGEEATFMILTDGNRFVALPSTQDHKPVFDGDKGPNTGGMGAYAPAPVVGEERKKEIIEKIVKPTLDGLEREGINYRGCLYFGLMLTKKGPYLLEFNCRFGDPEVQPLVMLMESDIVPFLKGAADGRLKGEIKWKEGAAVCVIMTSGGYPGRYEEGKEIKGLDEVSKMEDVVVFNAGVSRENGILKTAGGRVLAVTARADNLKQAIDLAYQAVDKISFENEYHRTDIGRKALM